MNRHAKEANRTQDSSKSSQIPPRPEPLSPVRWLLGRQLLNSLKGILLYTAYGKQLDPRDWMQAEGFPSQSTTESFNSWRDQRLKRQPKAKQAEEKLKKEKELDGNRTEDDYWNEENGFWFDYLADTGDSTNATYSIAYLCLSSFYAPENSPLLKPADDLKTCVQRDIKDDKVILPRGEFLFIGGDTAYHVSDYITLASRVQSPFEWAYRDLAKDRRESGECSDPKLELNRPVFGIPGNHDYYDQLNGFRRQFRLPYREERENDLYPETDDLEELANRPQLYLPGFRRYQQASYVALKLPFGWQLWGLDTEVGQIDERQRKFFRDLCEKGSKKDEIIPPKKLIVATCAPTTVFGKLADPSDEKATDAFKQLGLEQLFLPGQRQDGEDEALKTAGDYRMKSGECRLDISGDVHHYARYWGPKAQPISVTSGKAGAEETTRKAATATTPEAESYASVVSGIGGAFHHPSGTYIDEIQEQVLYPSEEVSTNEIAKRIFNPWQIFNGGFIWLGGAIIAFVIYFAAALEESSNHFIKIINDVINALLSNVYREIVLAKNWSQLSTALLPRFSSADNTWYLWGGALLLLLSLLVLASPFFPWLSKILFKTATGGSLGTSTKTQVRAGESQYIDYEISAKPEVPLWGITGLASILVFFGFYLLLPLNKPPILSFRLSLIIQYSIVWAVAAIALSLRYSEFLSKKSHRTIVQWHDWALTWVLTIAGLLSVTVGLRGFGGQLTAASLVSDLIFTLVGVGVFAGLIGLPIFAGGELLQPRREAPDESLSFGRKFLGRGLFGLWHAILQIVAPFLLTRGLLLMSPIRSVVWGLVTLIVLPALMWWVGKSLLKVCRRKLLLSRRGVLAIVWWIYGVLMLTLPYLWCKNEDLFPSVLITGWEAVAQLLLASLVGAVMACVWFGWYLGVCFAFNGHNNEVGGACRIEEFKQFIRFRLTKDGLTGYVIGIDKPEKNGQALKPRIIDVFHLHVKDGKCDKDKNDENKCRTV